MLRWLSDRKPFIGYAILAVGMAAALAMGALSIERVTEKDNATRCSIVGLVKGLTVNSARAAEATIHSPTATEAQKMASRTNLAAIREFLATTEDALAHPTGTRCS